MPSSDTTASQSAVVDIAAAERRSRGVEVRSDRRQCDVDDKHVKQSHELAGQEHGQHTHSPATITGVRYVRYCWSAVQRRDRHRWSPFSGSPIGWQADMGTYQADGRDSSLGPMISATPWS